MKHYIQNVEETTEYLATGGLGETLGLAYLALEGGQPKVQMNTDMAIALCLLADEALKFRRSAKS